MGSGEWGVWSLEFGVWNYLLCPNLLISSLISLISLISPNPADSWKVVRVDAKTT
ncbi:hypothetical protein H1Q63_05470 [Desmonostoc muscorum CCALA 125]|nr:hypothetical protein [Desmonostoc muscorum CCALA 125]